MSSYINAKMKEHKTDNLPGRLMKLEFVRFGIVGIIATAIHYSIYLLLMQLIDVNISYTAGYLISLACNFFLTAKFTFKAQASVKRGVGFILSHIVNYLLHMILLNVFIKAGIPSTFAPVPVYCIAVPVNFLLVRFVFRKF